MDREYKLSNSNPGHIKQEDVQAIGEALEAIEREHGYIDNALIVAAAKSKRSVLHQYVWDIDTGKVVDEYRRLRAGHVRRSITITYEHPLGEVNIPAFILMEDTEKSDAEEPHITFISVEGALSDEEQMRREGDRVFGYVYAYRNRLSIHPRFEALVQEMDRLSAEMEAAQRLVS